MILWCGLGLVFVSGKDYFGVFWAIALINEVVSKDLVKLLSFWVMGYFEGVVFINL